MEEIFDSEFIKEVVGKIFSIFSRNPNNRLEQMAELRDQAEYLADKTGKRPVSWYEFKRSTPAKAPSLLRSLLIGATIGLVGAGLIAGVLTLFSVQASFPWILGLNTLITGGTAAYSDYKNQPVNDQIKQYSAYLDEFEATVPAGRAYSIDKMPPLYEGEHVTRLRQENLMPLLRIVK